MRKDSMVIMVICAIFSYFIIINNNQYFDINKTIEKESVVQSLIAEQTGMVVTFN